MVNEDKMKALDAAISNIEKQFGKGSVMKLGESTANLNVECIPTGSLSLDIALGIGGVPKGRVVEIYGPESSGKTTLTLHAIAEVQKQGGTAAFIDAEHAFDRFYAAKLVMQSMLWILYMLRILGLILIIYIFRSLTAASRHLRLQRLW